MIVDLILAAGLGTRVGGTKGLLDLGGRPLLTRVLDEVAASPVSSAIVVLGAEAERLLPLTRRPKVQAVINPDFRAQQSLSIRLALEALPAAARAFLIHPVDHCLVTRAHLAALVAAFEKGDAATTIARPQYQGSWGHPVLYAAPYAAEILALGRDETARAVYRRHLDRVMGVDVADDGCLFDLDTPADLEEARRRVAAG
jgi:molybdenum cofactor cytidylyltransferase